MGDAFFHPSRISERAQVKQAKQDQIDSARAQLMEQREKTRVDSALRAGNGSVLVGLAGFASVAEPGPEQGDVSSATSITSSEDSDAVDREEPQAEAPAATQAPEAADVEPVARDFSDLIANFHAQSEGILARSRASAVKAFAAADSARAAADSARAAAGRAGLAQLEAELAQRKAELAQSKAELKAHEAANPSAKRRLDLAEDHASAGPQPSEASRPSRCTRSCVQRGIVA